MLERFCWLQPDCGKFIFLLMPPLHFVTTSSWKYKQGKAYLEKFGIQIKHANIELPESRSEDVLEIAKDKADFAYSQVKQPIFVLDGAFHIKALNGFPKTQVKFAEKYIGARGILKLLEGETERDYDWPNVLYYRAENTEKQFIGYIRGTIITEISDGHENGFDSIQLPDGYSKTFSQMDADDLKHFEVNVWQPTIFKEFAEWLKTK